MPRDLKEEHRAASGAVGLPAGMAGLSPEALSARIQAAMELPASPSLRMPAPQPPTLHLHASHAPSFDGLEAIPQWPPLKGSLPSFIPREEEQEYLTQTHIAFQKQIERLARTQSKDAAQEGLMLLGLIPEEEARRLEWFGTAKAFFLQSLGRKEEALLFQIELMLELQHERLWLSWGMCCVQWLQNHPHATQRAHILERLSLTCAEHAFVAPRLLLAYALWMDAEMAQVPPPAQAIQLYRETLRVEAWPWKHKKRTFKQSVGWQQSAGQWLAAISDGFTRMLRYFGELSPDADAAMMATITAQMHGFPWEQIIPKYRQLALRSMCSALAQSRLYADIERLCEAFQSILPHCPHREFWLGQALRMMEKPTQALSHFQKASKRPEEFQDVEKLHIADFLFSQKQLQETRTLLDQIEEKADLRYMRMEFWYAHLIGQHDVALQWIEKILAQTPDDFDAVCRRLRLLDLLQRHEQMERELLPLLQHEYEVLRHFAHVYLGVYYTISERITEALQCFDALPKGLSSEVFLQDKGFQSSFWLCYADGLERVGRWQEAESAYRYALELRPAGWAFARLIMGALRHERFALAQELLPQALALNPEDFYVRYTQVQLMLHAEQPSQARALLEQMGRDLFQQHQAMREWLVSWMRVLLDSNAPLEAWRWSEEYLDSFLKDPELRDIRKELMAELMGRYQQMEQQLAQQGQQLEQQESQLQSRIQKMERTRALLARKSEESQRRQDALQRALREQTSLRKELQAIQTQESSPAPLASPSQLQQKIAQFRQHNAPLLERLPESSQQLLCDAELLWCQLEAHPLADHGPVILQLSRVVEAEINRRLVDALARWTLHLGHSLTNLPTPALVALKRDGNRLSLGDAARLLYSQLQIKEPDGTVSLERNPYSLDGHAEILQAFWEQPLYAEISDAVKEYARNAMILDLRELARLRNQSSHAGKALSRSQAQQVRKRVLGTQHAPGMLTALVQFSA